METPKNSLSREYEKRLEQLSPFEIKNELIAMAEENARTSSATFLNAGRGNPNWIETDAREAFFLLGSFGIDECKRVRHEEPGIAGIPSRTGCAERFAEFLTANADRPGAVFLRKAWDYMVKKLGADPDGLAYGPKA